MSTLHGTCLPNMPLNRAPIAPNGPPAPRSMGWRLLQFGAVKFMQEHATVTDMRWCHERGQRVLVRVKGEAIVYHQDVLDAISAYAGLADCLEIGNEPPEAQLWDHLWYMQQIADTCLAPAHAAGLTLCVGGWAAHASPPDPTTDLGARLLACYNQFDAVALHCYDEERLDSGAVKDHMSMWRAAFANKPMPVTEYGCAAKMLPGCATQAESDAEKVRRYAAFVAGLPDWVPAAYAFILSGTQEWFSFTEAGVYDPAGVRGYVVGDAAYPVWASAVGA